MRRTRPHPSTRVPGALSSAGIGRSVLAPPCSGPAGAAGAAGARGEERALRLLAIGTPAEVLARLVPEDSLGLRSRLGAHLARLALLVDAERLLLRAQALCALHAPSWRGVPRLEAWLDERVLEALSGFLAEEHGPGEGAAGRTFEPFAVPLALDPEALAQACARFNRLPLECREAFFALVLQGNGQGEGADRLARERGLSLSELARRARIGLELFRRVGATLPEAPRPRAGEGRS